MLLVVFIHLKAFETRNSTILIKQLEKYGMKHLTFNWFKSYINYWNSIYPMEKISLILQKQSMVSCKVKSWMYDRTFVSFWDFYLFEPKFLFTYQRFPNGLKPRRNSGFVINCFWNYQELEGKNKKAWFWGNFSHCQIFETFGISELRN